MGLGHHGIALINMNMTRYVGCIYGTPSFVGHTHNWLVVSQMGMEIVGSTCWATANTELSKDGYIGIPQIPWHVFFLECSILRVSMTNIFFCILPPDFDHNAWVFKDAAGGGCSWNPPVHQFLSFWGGGKGDHTELDPPTTFEIFWTVLMLCMWNDGRVGRLWFLRIFKIYFSRVFWFFESSLSLGSLQPWIRRPETVVLSHHFWSISSQSQKSWDINSSPSPATSFGISFRRRLGFASPAPGGSLQVARAAAGALPGLWVAGSAAAEAGGW